MDTYFRSITVTERLFAEYKKHGSLIVAFDFDDTIFDYHEKGDDHTQVIELLKECQELKFKLVIWTAGKPERYNDMLKYCYSIGLHPDSINKNPIELPFGKWGKIYYNILLDDRAGLLDAYIALKQVVKRIKDEISNSSRVHTEP